MCHVRSFLGFAFGIWIAGPTAAAADRIDQAVKRGAAVLRITQKPNGCWGEYGAGSTALAGLALLECGAKADDPAMVKAAEFIRTEIIPNYETYHVSLSIIFLDRLGDAADLPLIQALGVRLMEGQFPLPLAGWNYRIPRPTEAEIARLRGQPKKIELKTEPKKPDDPQAPRPKLDPDLERRLEALEKGGPTDAIRQPDGSYQSGASPDNSNSQFAVLALWIARRNGVPTESSLRRAEAWYRASHENGSWTYSPTGISPYGRGATTCAGLLGLAVGAGVAKTPTMEQQPDDKPAKAPAKPHPLADQLVQAALRYVAAELASMTRADAPSTGLDRDYYFLWSLERVAMIYSLPKMAGIDWFALGSTLILLHEQPTGGWKGRYALEIDTAFALLFLRRSNFAPDLSSMLKVKSQPALTAKDQPVAEKPVPSPPGMTAVAEAEKLARELLTANEDRKLRILERLRDEKGSEYSDALAAVIPQLTEETQRKARDCLAERLARMTPTTIRAKLRDSNVEFRRAAALACAVKEDRSLLADLITALDDKEFLVVRAAAVALQTLTGEDLGPANNATAEQRAKAVAAWKAWWKKQTP